MTPRLSMLLLLVASCIGCAGKNGAMAPGAPLSRTGDEIVVAGQYFHTGAPVVLWTDPGGYDAYRVERRFAPMDEAGWRTEQGSPNRYGLRRDGLGDEDIERVRGGGWDLETLRRVVDQFVIHYDACGTSRTCFRVLHDERHLSVHFLLDIDGTIYQTLDVKERAWHATTSNSRSVGIEIANIGAYAPGRANPLDEWYGLDARGRRVITIPERLGDAGVRTPGFVGHPARHDPIVGEIQGQVLEMYDLTDEQYDSLIKLTATLCSVLARIECDFPRGSDAELVRQRLSDDVLSDYHGLLGHYHVQEKKVDPGPAFDWDRLVERARSMMAEAQGPR